MRRSWNRWLMLMALVVGVSASLPIRAEQGVVTTLVPIGASYQQATLDLFVEQVVQYNDNDTVEIAVLLAPFNGIDPFFLDPADRQINIDDAMVRVGNLQDTCEALVVTPTMCLVTLPDVQVRSDALSETNAMMFDAAVDGVYMLGGDQVIAMQVIANTPVEDALEALYENGVPFGGNSAGAAMQSRHMIAGYVGDNYPWDGLQAGAIELWYEPTTTITRGLRFALDNAVVDQHVLERGRLLRLLQAAEQLPTQHIGLGVDWGTGVRIRSEQFVDQTAGFYAGIIVDLETYAAAENAVYTGTHDSLAVHDVAFHILPEGPYGYDLVAQRPMLSDTVQPDAPELAGRSFDMLQAPAGAGSLFVGGDLTGVITGSVVSQFAAQAALMDGPAAVVGIGFEADADATIAVDEWAMALASLGLTDTQTLVITPDTDLMELSDLLQTSGSLTMIGGDQDDAALMVPLLKAAGLDQQLHSWWSAGHPLLFDNAAAAMAGESMTSSPNQTDQADVEIEASDSFIDGTIAISEGLGLVAGAIFEPRAFYDYRYGRLVSHVYAQRDLVAFGIELDTALEITPEGAWVRGPSAVLAVDGRYTSLFEVGANDAYAAYWLLLDTWTTDQAVHQTTAQVYLPYLSK